MALTKEDLIAIKGIVDDSVKVGISGLERRIDGIETDVKGLKTDVAGLKTDVADLKDRVTRIEVVQIENRILPVLEEVHRYQKDVYERYYNDAQRFEEKIALIDTTAQIVSEHSKQIKGLQEKMA